MKLRIKGNSMRLRVSPSEMTRLLKTGRIEETIHFGPAEDAKLTYALEHASHSSEMTLRHQPLEVAVVIPTKDAQEWAQSEQVSLYGAVGAGDRRLELVVEKDFACLDKSEAENQDTYPNPKQGHMLTPRFSFLAPHSSPT
jgi:hypothetical protein